MPAKSHQACLTLCDCIDWSPPGSFVHEILQARILEWVACPPSRGSSGPRDPTRISYDSFIDKQILYHYCHLGSPKMKMSGSQLCLTLRPHGLEIATLLCPWDSSGKNTGVGSHSFLQRIFPAQESNPGLLHCWKILYPLSHQGRQENSNLVTLCS